MKNNNPLVTICIPAFNSERVIHRAIESCIRQTYRNIEVLIVDDASTDNTAEIVRVYSMNDTRIKYFKNEMNLGGEKNFFMAIKLASGTLIQGLCHDDWISEDYIEECVNNFKEHPDVGAVFNSVLHFSLNKDTFIPILNHQHNFFINKFRNYPTLPLLRSGYNSKLIFIAGFAAMFRKEDFTNVFGFMSNIMESSEYRLAHQFGFWGGELVSLRILSKYNRFTCVTGTAYVKVLHSSNYGSGDGLPKDVFEKVALSSALREFYGEIYKKDISNFFSNFRIDFAALELVDTFVYLIKIKFWRSEFKNIIRAISIFLNDYSPTEKYLITIKSLFVFLVRVFENINRKLFGKLGKRVKFLNYYHSIFLIKEGDGAKFSSIYEK